MTENEDHLEIRTQSHEQVIEMVICEWKDQETFVIFGFLWEQLYLDENDAASLHLVIQQ
jgi:hypothetical protein